MEQCREVVEGLAYHHDLREREREEREERKQKETLYLEQRHMEQCGEVVEG
jgi:hypothetical protein